MRASTKRKLNALNSTISNLYGSVTTKDKAIKLLVAGIIVVLAIVFFILFIRKKRGRK